MTENRGEAGRRLCPSCLAAADIGSDEDLWPLDWRCAVCGTAPAHACGMITLAPILDPGDPGFEPENFGALSKIEPGNFWFVRRNEMIAWLVRRFAPNADRALELGAGTGFTLFALRDTIPKARIAASELHAQGLEICRGRHGEAVELFQMDARNVPLRGVIDLVCAFDVIEHIREDDRVLGEVFELLRPGGILVATVPQHPWMWSAADDVAHHQRRYALGELAKKATDAGLRPIYTSSFVVLAFPAMALSRLLARGEVGRPGAAAEAEFQISPLANAFLSLLCRIEHVLRRIGLPMPFGGSQVLVAQRPA